MAHKAGGGIASRQRVEKPVRYGERSRNINERGVSQIGQAMGDHITEKNKILKHVIEPVRGGLRPPGAPGGIPLGNQIAGNVGAGGGPGKGRVLYGRGSQGQHGSAVPGVSRPTKGQWP